MNLRKNMKTLQPRTVNWRIIHDLTVLLQAAPDLISVQERVLGAVTTDLGFSKAVVALVDPAREELGGWLVYPRDESFPTVETLPLKSENGEVFKALLNRNILHQTNEILVKDPDFNHGSIKTIGSSFRFICGNTPLGFYSSMKPDSPRNGRIP